MQEDISKEDELRSEAEYWKEKYESLQSAVEDFIREAEKLV